MIIGLGDAAPVPFGYYRGPDGKLRVVNSAKPRVTQTASKDLARIAAYRLQQAEAAKRNPGVDKSSAGYQAAVDLNKIAIAMRKSRSPSAAAPPVQQPQPSYSISPAGGSDVGPSQSAQTTDPDAPMPPTPPPEAPTLLEKFTALSLPMKAALVGGVGFIGYKVFFRGAGSRLLSKSF